MSTSVKFFVLNYGPKIWIPLEFHHILFLIVPNLPYAFFCVIKLKKKMVL